MYACNNNVQKNKETLRGDNVIKSIKAALKLPDGIYIRGSAQDYPVLFTIDTGASRTLISKHVFESMKQEELKCSSKLVGASRAVIKTWEMGLFKLTLGPVQLEVEAIVADIDHDGLVGVDVLQNGDSRPADLMMIKDVLLIDVQEVPIIQLGMKTRTRRVYISGPFCNPSTV